MAAFFRNCVRCDARLFESASAQKRWPATVVGTSEAARSGESGAQTESE